MHIAASALLFTYALLTGIWPLVWLFAIARQAIARHWPSVVRLALLLPLWTVAVSVGGLQVHSLLAAAIDSAAAQTSPRPVLAATAMLVALCAAVVAWLLLLRLIRENAGSHSSNVVQSE